MNTTPDQRPSPSSVQARSALPPPLTCWSAVSSRSCSKPGRRSATPCGNGRMSGCSRRGSTRSTRPPCACSSRRAGIRPIRTPIRPAANWSSAISSRWRPARRCATHIHTSARVTGIGRVGFDKVKTAGPRGRAVRAALSQRRRRQDHPRRCGHRCVGHLVRAQPGRRSGLPAIGEDAVQARIAYGMPDVLGSAARSLCRQARRRARRGSFRGRHADRPRNACAICTGTEIIWLIRGDNPAKSFGGGVNDKLVERGALGSLLARLVGEGAHPGRDRRSASRISTRPLRGCASARAPSCCGREVVADELIVATGFRPELGFLSELRLSLDPALECPPLLAPLIDPNEHSCGTVRPHGALELAQPEPGFYFAGMKSYGRAPTFLMLTGYEQVRSIAAELAGDIEAARRVELVLPETGVCNGPGLDGKRGLLRRPGEGRRIRLLRAGRNGEEGRRVRLWVFMNDGSAGYTGRSRSLPIILALGTTQTHCVGVELLSARHPCGADRARSRPLADLRLRRALRRADHRRPARSARRPLHRYVRRPRPAGDLEPRSRGGPWGCCRFATGLVLPRLAPGSCSASAWAWASMRPPSRR